MSVPSPSVTGMTSTPAAPPTDATSPALSAERADILDSLHKHRDLFRATVRGLSDEQAALTPTASELCLGGLVKHVATTESEWADFIEHGAADTPDVDWSAIDWSAPPAEVVAYQNQFRMLEGETLESILAHYDEVAGRTDALVATADLDAGHELPKAPWFEPGASWTVRRTLLHVIAETAQHAGHADILRESIDGQKTMG